MTQEFEKIDRPRQVHPQSQQRRRRRQMIDVQRPQKSNKNYASEYAEQPARHPEGQQYPRPVNRENNRCRQKRQFGSLKNSQDESQTKESDGNAGQRAQEGSTRRVASQPVRAKRSCSLHNAAQKARKHTQVLGEL